MIFREEYAADAVDYANGWARAHADFIDVVFAGFLATGRWSTPRDLQRQLDRAGEHVDVLKLAQELPKQLGTPWRGSDGDLVLRIRALQYCGPAAPILGAAISLLALAYERYMSDDPTPRLLATDLTSDQLQRAAVILQREVFNMVHGSREIVDSEWVGTINTALARELRGVQSIEDYLVKEAAYFLSEGLSSAAMLAARTGVAVSNPASDMSFSEAVVERKPPTLLELLERQMASVDAILACPAISIADSDQWIQTTAGILISRLDPNHRHVKAFHSASFLRAISTLAPEAEREAARRENLKRKRTSLKSIIEQEELTSQPVKEEAANYDPRRVKRPLPRDPRRAFVVHGRNSILRESMFAFLRSIGLDPIEWAKARKLTGNPNPYLGEVLEAAFAHAAAVVVVMSPDDVVFLREEFRDENDPAHESVPTGAARPNVLFEAGVAMGWDASRTVLVECGRVRPFSDIGGRHVVRLDNSGAQRQELASRLMDAGCPVDLDGSDWHTVGDFEPSNLDFKPPSA